MTQLPPNNDLPAARLTRRNPHRSPAFRRQARTSANAWAGRLGTRESPLVPQWPFVAILLPLLVSCRRPTTPNSSDATTGLADAALRFVDGAGKTVSRLRLTKLVQALGSEVVEIDDPIYRRKKRFRTLPMAAVLGLGFGKSREQLGSLDFALQATDGYMAHSTGRKLILPAAKLAFADVSHPPWQAIGPRRLSPAPFYLVWRGPKYRDSKRYPWPWGLIAIRIQQPSQTALLSPGANADPAAQRGQRIFLGHCLGCHAINRQGGRVGPELNLPRSIIEYRPITQLRAFIRDPQSFRYSNMPAQPQLSDGDLDALIAYLRAMSQRKAR